LRASMPSCSARFIHWLTAPLLTPKARAMSRCFQPSCFSSHARSRRPSRQSVASWLHSDFPIRRMISKFRCFRRDQYPINNPLNVGSYLSPRQANGLQISRILVREALRQLEGEGLISFYPPPRDGRLRALLRGGARDLRDPGRAGNHDDPQGDPTPFPKRNSNVPRRCSTL